jgi:hypothetical protein
VADILETIAARFSLESAVRERTDVVRAGQTQVRIVWADVCASHLCPWKFIMTEACARSRQADDSVDRSDST